MTASGAKKIIFIAGLALFSALVAVYVCLSLRDNGQMSYPLDDAYIHMAIAKNFAQHGTWGITRHEFTSTTSSPLYTFLLALVFLVTGPNDYVPLALNISFGLLFLYTLYRFAQARLDAVSYGICNTLVILLTPLHILVISGMEHMLQVLLVFWLTVLVLRSDSREDFSLREAAPMLLCSGAAVMTRYEDIFLVGCLSLLLMYRKKFSAAVLLIVAGLVPVIVYGLVSLSKGFFFFPNSILLKGAFPELSLRGLYFALYRAMRITALYAIHLVGAVFLLGTTVYVLRSAQKEVFVYLRRGELQCALILTIVAHTLFASVGWFFRYEAYLIALTVIWSHPLYTYASAPLKALFSARRVAFALSIVLCFSLLFLRLYDSVDDGRYAMKNIHEQQVQMARFLQACYPRVSIAANDIGAISYYNDLRLFDMAGLGNAEVIRDTTKPRRLFFERMCAEKQVQIAIIYDSWFKGEIPEGWIKAGEWTIRNNHICGDSTVSFYAVGEDHLAHLTSSLKSFSRKLDQDVVQRGLFTLE